MILTVCNLSLQYCNIPLYHVGIHLYVYFYFIFHPPGCTFGAHRSLPHSQRQPSGPTAPVYGPGPQARVGALQ